MRKILIILGMCLGLMGFVRGQYIYAQTLTWEDCVGLALHDQPDLVSSSERLKQAQDSKTVTQSGLFPQISGSAGTQKSKTAGLDSQQSYSYGLSGSQLLFDGAKTMWNKAAANENIKNAQYNYAVTSSNIRLSLRVAFVNLLKAQEAIKLTEDIAVRRRQNLDLINLRYQAGREHKGSLMTAQADLAESDFEVDQAKRNLQLAQRQLVKTIGLPAYDPLQVSGSFQITGIQAEEPNFENLAAASPLLQSLIAQREAARYGLSSAQSSYLPQIFASGSVNRSGGNWPPDQKQWSLGVNLSLPIFSGGSQVAAAAKARSAYDQSKADERSGRDGVIFTLVQAWTDFRDAAEQVAVQEKFLAAAQERSKISESQYSIGLITFDDWIIIEDNLINTKKNYLNTQANALIAEANWRQAKGETLDEK
jgi:outer membrane protein TolC